MKNFAKDVAKIIVKAVVVVFSIIFVLAVMQVWVGNEAVSDGTCNVAVFPVEGMILPFDSYTDYPLVTTPRTVRDFVAKAEEDPMVKALLVEVNSPGGTPVASEQISQTIRNTTLPTVSLIGDIGASGGYLVAAGADKMLASAMSDVGSIGVTMSYTEESKKNEEEGVTFVPLSSGKFKDAGNPNKPLTEEERALFEEDLEIIHDEFVRKVAELRGKSVEEIEALADGASMPGVRALEVGLIDQIGGRIEAKEELAHQLQIDPSEIKFCEYVGPVLPF